MSWISKDGRIILINRGIRSFGYGFIAILLGIYLKELGFQPFAIGLLLSTAIIGGALFTLLTGRYAARYGIQKMLLMSILLSLAGIAIFLATSNFLFLLLASVIGFISPSGRELGPFLSLEQAYLPFTVSDTDRTTAFAYWNIIASLAVSLGALMGSLPLLLQSYFGMEKILSFKVMFLLYFILNAAALILYLKLSEVKFGGEKVELSNQSRSIITKLAILFGLDSFASGLVITSILSLWFYAKFQVPLSTLSALFFAAGLLETLSYYLSGRIARRFGLINTMVFTHIPSSIFLILIPFMPSFYLAAFFLLLRQLFSEMDIPARQSYVVAMVRPEEKAIATSITNVAKIIATAFGPTVATVLLFPFAPFLVAGVLKISYDVTLYFNFRKLKPPEEAS